MTQNGSLPRRAVAAIAASAIVAFALSLLLTLKGSEEPDEGVGANSFSRSAIGHRGFYGLCEVLGYRPARFFQLDAERLEGAALVLAEPFIDPQTISGVKQLETAKSALLVLPKWRAQPDWEHKGWAFALRPVPLDDANAALATTGEGDVARVEKPAPFGWNLLGAKPELGSQAQLIRNSRLRPLIASPDGVLLGELRTRDRRLFVLSDPDVLSNQGLDKGENARLVANLLSLLVAPGGRVIVNEAIHGETGDPRVAPPIFLALLSRFPYPVIVAQLLIGLLLLLASSVGRFGAPRTRPNPLGAGKRGLIANSAQLLAQGGHQTAVLRRYVDVTIREVARRLKAPKQHDDAALILWLRRLGAARGVSVDCGAVLADAERAIATDAHTPIAAARAIHVWKTEILDGHSGRRRDR